VALSRRRLLKYYTDVEIIPHFCVSPELLFLTKLTAAEEGRGGEGGGRGGRGGRGKEKKGRRNASLRIFSAPIPRRTYFSHSLCYAVLAARSRSPKSNKALARMANEEPRVRNGSTNKIALRTGRVMPLIKVNL